MGENENMDGLRDIEAPMKPVTTGGHELPENWLARIALIWGGNALSVVAAAASTFAVVWYVTVSTASPLMLAVVYCAAFLPLGLLSPFGGVVADKVNRKVIMLSSDMVIAVMSFAMALVVLLSEPSLFVVVAFCLTYGLASAFRGPAYTAAMPLMVPADAILRINTMDGLLSSLSVIIAPVIGIFLYTVFGLQLVLFINGLCALASFGTMLIAKIPPIEKSAEGLGAWASLLDGAKELGGARGLLLLLVAVSLGMMAYGPIDSLLPLMVSDYFHGDGFIASLLAAAMGVGMLVGTIALMVMNLSQNLARVSAFAIVVIGVAAIAAGFVPDTMLPLFFACVVVIAFAAAWLGTPIVTLLQVHIAESKLGRVMGLYAALMGVAVPVGTLIGGTIAEVTGMQQFFVIDGVLIVALGVVTLLSKEVEKYNASILKE